jgi:hypothetical protein
MHALFLYSDIHIQTPTVKRGLCEALLFAICLCWLGSYDKFVGSLAALAEGDGIYERIFEN